MAKQKKVYKIKDTGEEVLLVKDKFMSGCTDCVLSTNNNTNDKRCHMKPTNCIRMVFGIGVYFHFEKAF